MPDIDSVSAHPQNRSRFRVLRRLVAAWFRDPTQFSRPQSGVPKFTCPMCGYHGMFISVGRPTRWDARCPDCGSRERHRLTWLWVTEAGNNKFTGKRIIHFAPEKIWMKKMQGQQNYETADLYQKNVTHQENITKLSLPDNSFDVVMCHHVLEHIDDDTAAMKELFRILKPGGLAVLSVPINTSRYETYEDKTILDPAIRRKCYGGTDHLRFYGMDFGDKLNTAGFKADSFRLPEVDETRYGLLNNEFIYIAHKA